MFISHVNKNFKFSQQHWVLSVIDFAQSLDEFYKASIVIEGVVNHKLLFARYDVFTKECEQSSKAKPRAYIHHIDYFESSKYSGSLSDGSSISYQVLPSECQKLSDHIHGIALLFENQDPEKLAPELILFPVTIEKASLHWCLNFLGEHHILNRVAPDLNYQ